METRQIKPFLGQTLYNVEVEDNKRIYFTFDNGKKYQMYHDQNCCEYVYIESIVGDLDDLVGNPLLIAEEVSEKGDTGDDCGSCTWTFYKFATVKGYVDIRWYGESNGYYSESVDIEEVIK